MIQKINSGTILVELYKSMFEIYMRETSIMNNQNCKMQAHARVCEENNEELAIEAKMMPSETIMQLKVRV